MMTGKDHKSGRRVDRGFTLVELMIVISIIAIGLMITIPNFQLWLDRSNATGFVRDVYSEFQEARVRATSTSSRHRLVINLGNKSVTLQQLSAGAWTGVRRQINASSGASIGSVVPTPGAAVSTGRYALVFNPTGEVYGQSDVNDDTTIAVLTQANITFPGKNALDNASITVFGWTGKARLN